tara:strand:+ start:797 stop:1828 length:1032 start_codon:yes stop_codon:yes gene_type:complete
MDKERKLVELLIDEQQEEFGILAISLVKYPAIEENFIFLNKDSKLSFAKLDEEKQLLYGAALIPEKKIPRYNQETNEEYDVYFTKETIKQASELFLKFNKANEHTLEHNEKIQGVSVVESWIVDDTNKDKSNLYGFSLPIGTWFVGVKIHNNNDVWESVKNGEIKGFSIEGFFIDKIVEMHKDKKEDNLDVDLTKDWDIDKRIDATTLGAIKSLIMENEITPIAELDGEPLFSNKEEAELYAVLYKKCRGHHKHIINNTTYYMACVDHKEAIQENYSVDDKGKKRKKRKRGYMKYAKQLAYAKNRALAKYPWDECIRDMKKEYGSEETAKKVCSAIKNKSVRR